MVISTGISEFFEIDKAVRTIESCGNKEIVILHCVSLYPPKDQEVNLRNIETLQKTFPYPIGFSDHTIGIEIPLAYVALGVKLIEKHFTLDTEMEGWDHKVSATPEPMKLICSGAGVFLKPWAPAGSSVRRATSAKPRSAAVSY